MFDDFRERIGAVRAGLHKGRCEQHSAPGFHRRSPASGAVLGFAMLAMLVGCADQGMPSEASSERAVVNTSQAASVPPGHLRTIGVLDDCDPDDPSWTPIGGCVLAGGQISEAEFIAALPQGHPSWQNVPAYATVALRGQAFRNIRAVNEGGRPHTFTRVAAYGGGIVPPLNPPGQPVAPECADGATFGASLLPPGASLQIETLQPGVHRYQCCFHPWMRTELRVD
jgi:hypothetical protein